MQRHHPSLATALALLLCGSSNATLGAGFALNEQSATTLGRALADRASSAEDATTLFGNPAGMARLKQGQVVLGAAVIDARSSIRQASAHIEGVGLPIDGSNKGDMVPTSTVPWLYYAQPLDERWAVGVGLYAPFGLSTDYEHSFQGRYQGLKSEVQVITLQPTVSYRIDPHWSVGVGVTYNRIDGKLTGALPQPPLADGRSRIKGDDATWGYNVGLLFEPTEATRVGLRYFSKQDYTLGGHTDLHTAQGSLRYSARLGLELPESVDLAISQEVGDWTLHAGTTWTRWKRFDELHIRNTGGPDIVEPENWKNVWGYAVGADYRINEQWLVRAGAAIDESPIPSAYRTVRIPSADRRVLALGASWTPMPALSVDIAYGYLKEDRARINQTRDFQGVPFNYQARYKNKAHLMAVQLTYRF